MEWIPRTDLSKLPTNDYCEVLVNLQTPTRLKTTVMTYYPPEYDEEGIIVIEHSFSRNNPQNWDNNFTHYCLFPEPCGWQNVGLKNAALPIFDVSKRAFKIGDKVKVLIGCVWQNAKVEDIKENEWYTCGTSKWSTDFHVSSIKHVC
jgi:hypothetical protein